MPILNIGGRTSPVLFPFVGSLNGGIYKVEDKEYAMGQHGLRETWSLY